MDPCKLASHRASPARHTPSALSAPRHRPTRASWRATAHARPEGDQARTDVKRRVEVAAHMPPGPARGRVGRALPPLRGHVGRADGVRAPALGPRCVRRGRARRGRRRVGGGV